MLKDKEKAKLKRQPPNGEVKTATPIDAYLLLDRSSSMANRWGEALGSINAYAKELKSREVPARSPWRCSMTTAGYSSASSAMRRSKIGST